MKTVFFFLTICFVTPSLHAQKVNFRKLSWDEANKAAQAESKFIFVDAYTTWCGWCREMDKKLLTIPSVASLLNNNFIPVKIDFEDSTGIILAKKFRVWAFPTTLVFNPSGQLVGRFGGYTPDSEKYLHFLNECLNTNEEQVFGYNSHDLNIDFPEFYNASFYKEGRRWPSDSTVNAYLSKADLFSEAGWSVLLKFNPEQFEDSVFKHYNKFKQIYGNDETATFVMNIIDRKLNKAIKNDDSLSLQKALKLVDYLDRPAQYRIELLVAYSKARKDWPAMTTQLNNLIELNGVNDPLSLNNNCWTMYEECEDQTTLNQVKTIMKAVVEVHHQWMYTDTYAHLLYKTGNYNEALTYTDLAIKEGETEKADVTETVKLRKKILEKLK